MQIFDGDSASLFISDRDFLSHACLVLRDARESARTHWYRRPDSIRTAIDTKLIYDSFVWRNALRTAIYSGRDVPRRVLEFLLPGWSRTIPLALCSLGFHGELVRLDRRAERV